LRGAAVTYIQKPANIEFDPAKDAANVEKHGISLARAADLDLLAFVEDDRFEESRYRIYGLIDDGLYCLVATDRGDKIRVISLRRVHAKEMRRYAQ
jgi:uncharacterized protein